MLNATFNILTAIQNDSVLIDYGDSSSSTLVLSSSNYSI